MALTRVSMYSIPATVRLGTDSAYPVQVQVLVDMSSHAISPHRFVTASPMTRHPRMCWPMNAVASGQVFHQIGQRDNAEADAFGR